MNPAIAVSHPRFADVLDAGFESGLAAERTSFPREVAEATLAHLVGDETARAYRRGDALDKRRSLMDAWASFCSSAKGGSVVAFTVASELSLGLRC